MHNNLYVETVQQYSITDNCTSTSGLFTGVTLCADVLEQTAFIHFVCNQL